MCCYAHITSSAEFVNGTSSFRNWNLFRRRHVIIFTLLTLVCVCWFHRGSIIDTIHRVGSVVSRRANNKKALSLVLTYGTFALKFSNFQIVQHRKFSNFTNLSESSSIFISKLFCVLNNSIRFPKNPLNQESSSTIKITICFLRDKISN